MELKKIIVIEDSEKHFQDAMKVLGEKCWPDVRDGWLSGNMNSALRMIQRLPQNLGVVGSVGVLTDLYIPSHKEDFWDSPHGPHGELAPLGMIVMIKCKELGIPCVLVTSGYHHGKKYNQPILALREFGFFADYIVDHYCADDMEAETDTKDWGQALEKLAALAAKIGAG